MGQNTMRRRVPQLARRLPATIMLVGILLATGVATGALWQPFTASDAFDTLAYGLPALEAGRWWTPITGTFVISAPWLYLVGLPTLVGMGFLEVRRGTRVASAYFAVGQLFSIFAASLFLWLAAFLSWP